MNNDALNRMKEPDIYSVLCGLLYELKDDPDYAILSELAYLLDNKSFINLIQYFGGQTVKIPTVDEVKECIQLLLLYQYVNIEKKPWKDALVMAGFSTSRGKYAHIHLDKLEKLLNNYNYGNRNY